MISHCLLTGPSFIVGHCTITSHCIITSHCTITTHTGQGKPLDGRRGQRVEDVNSIIGGYLHPRATHAPAADRHDSGRAQTDVHHAHNPRDRVEQAGHEVTATRGDHHALLPRAARLLHHLLHLPVGGLPGRGGQSEERTSCFCHTRVEAHWYDQLILYVVYDQIPVFTETEEEIRIGLVMEADDGAL